MPAILEPPEPKALDLNPDMPCSNADFASCGLTVVKVDLSNVIGDP